MNRLYVKNAEKKRPGGHITEKWLFEDSLSGIARSYRMNVRLGKPVDILSLKSDMVDNFERHLERIKITRKRLFSSAGMEKAASCPVCGLSSEKSVFLLDIYKARLHQCPGCSHCYIFKRPTKEKLDEFYSKDTDYASTYTDRRSLKTRMEQVVMPKAKWMVERFTACYKKRPKAILDVGAGGGHFVYACRKLGLDARGIEPSRPAAEFGRKHFGIELEAADFTKEWKRFSGADIVTFWGVIEHVPNPVDFLKTAGKLLSGKKGLVIAEVPRWDSLSSVIQKLLPEAVVRHLEPLGHINLFTDASLVAAFKAGGLMPVAAWYFGMDAYELVMQVSFLTKDKRRALETFKPSIAPLQRAVDRRRLSDEIVLAGRPDDEEGSRNG